MRRHRGFLAVVVLLALGVPGLVGGAYYFWLNQLPHPAQATRGELLRWLALRDVAAEPADVQIALVDRLQEELKAGLASDGAEFGGSTSGGGMSALYRDQVEANLATLERVWFETRVAQYADLTPDRKSDFLEEQINVIAAWSTLSPEPEPSATSGATEAAITVKASTDEPQSSASGFFDHIEDWIEDAQGEQRRQMLKGVQDGLVCWLATRDLAEQPMSLRRDLALRIARELDAGLDAGGSGGGMPAERRQRLADNGLLLLEAWLIEQSLEYASLEGDERSLFIDEKINALVNWKLASLTKAEGGGDAPPANAAASLSDLSQKVDGWIARADEPLREPMQQLFDDFRRRVIWRAFNGTLPASP